MLQEIPRIGISHVEANKLRAASEWTPQRGIGTYETGSPLPHFALQRAETC